MQHVRFFLLTLALMISCLCESGVADFYDTHSPMRFNSEEFCLNITGGFLYLILYTKTMTIITDYSVQCKIRFL